MVILIGIWMGIRMVLRMTVTMIPDRRINRLMYCDCRVVFATENIIIYLSGRSSTADLLIEIIEQYVVLTR